MRPGDATLATKVNVAEADLLIQTRFYQNLESPRGKMMFRTEIKQWSIL